MYLKFDVVMSTNKFQSLRHTCNYAFGINPPRSHCTPSFTWKADLKFSGVHLDYYADDKLRLSLEANMRVSPASVVGNRYVKRSDTKKNIFGTFKIYTQQVCVSIYQQETLLKPNSPKNQKIV